MGFSRENICRDNTMLVISPLSTCSLSPLPGQPSPQHRRIYPPSPHWSDWHINNTETITPSRPVTPTPLTSVTRLQRPTLIYVPNRLVLKSLTSFLSVPKCRDVVNWEFHWLPIKIGKRNPVKSAETKLKNFKGSKYDPKVQNTVQSFKTLDFNTPLYGALDRGECACVMSGAEY